MNLVVGFDQPQAALLPLVGGKGCNLIVLSAPAFPCRRASSSRPWHTGVPRDDRLAGRGAGGV